MHSKVHPKYMFLQIEQHYLPDFEIKRQCPVSIVNLHQTSSQLAESPVPGQASAGMTLGPGSVLHSDDELKEMRE